MVGQLLKDGVPVVALAEDGVWRGVRGDPAAERLAAFLTGNPLVRDRQVGDSHLPPGVAVLSRAATLTKLELQLAQPLPADPPGLLR